MKAIIVHTADEKPVLNWEDVPDVTIRPNECLVTVRATAVNRADLSQARGNYPPPPGASDILGLEMAGEIAAVGADVTGWQVGDRVCALLPGGGYAEQAAVPGGMLLPLPEHWSFAQGAAVPEVWLTAFVNLFLEGKLQAGETALIHAGASGVGTAAIQLAKAAGATVYVTAGATHKLDRCRELGADLAINYKEQDFSAEILAVSDGVDVILDPVGAGYLARNAEVCRRFGRIVNIGLLGGAQAQINMAHVLRKRLTIIGSTLRTRPLAEKIAITTQFADRFWDQLLSGELQIVIDSQFPVEQAQQAHDYVAQNRNIGKVVLTVA
ncbi:MAG: NAD(P)H-quinone oxidoreductase [Anaerolineae bacterium]|nr:NAD(P)H-quinone oxidoreductase [Anaerolineae bacterium]